MEKRQPSVSVVMATYNGEKYIREQIDSILNQSYPVHELIIQDDCSTDATPAICRDYASRHPNVSFFQNERNLGFNDNFRTAAMRATGDLVALSDDDDVWFPTKIEKQVAAIGDHDLCTCAISRGETPDKAREEAYSNDTRPGSHLFKCILGHTMLARRGFLQDGEHWQGGLTFDWSLTLHADWGAGIARVDETLVFHRAHDKSFSNRQAALLRPASKTAPFIRGKACFRELQQRPKFKDYFKYVLDHTGDAARDGIKLQHRIAQLMLSHSEADYLRLCLLCMKRRKEIYYPRAKANGAAGMLRGLFFPAIFAYFAPTVLLQDD